MADENYQNLNERMPYYSKDADFSIVETEQESSN